MPHMLAHPDLKSRLFEPIYRPHSFWGIPKHEQYNSITASKQDTEALDVAYPFHEELLLSALMTEAADGGGTSKASNAKLCHFDLDLS